MSFRCFTHKAVVVVSVVVGVGLGTPAVALAAGQGAVAAPAAINVDSTIETYCGPTDTIRDTSRNMSFFMLHTGSTFNQGRWIKHYEARYLDGTHFKYTDNRC
jgi:hypothetical protein